MLVTNIHTRTLERSKEEVGRLLDSLATEDDKLWPYENWPRMYLDKGLQVGSKGGHAPIKYEVVDYIPHELLRFEFMAPEGFVGSHQFEVKQIESGITELTHTIKMRVVGKGIFTWYFAIMHLHNALLRDLFAKAQVSLGLEPQVYAWSFWVRFLRWLFSGGKSKRQKMANKNKHPVTGKDSVPML